MKKKWIVLLIIAMLGFAGCNSKDETSNSNSEAIFPISIKDTEGIETIIDKSPEKIISLSPGITENIAALGGLERLVGRTSFCDYPPEVLNIKDVGSLYQPDAELIASLEPDLIIAGAHTDPETLKNLRDLGMKCIRLYDSANIDGLYENIITTGKILENEKGAQDKVSEIKANIEKIVNLVKDEPKPKVYYCLGAGDTGDYTAGGDTFINAIIEMAGGENIAKDITGWSYSKEALIEANPDIIIVGAKTGFFEQLPQMDGYKDLDAVKNNKLFAINENYIDRFSVYIDKGVEEIAKIFHPDKF